MKKLDTETINWEEIQKRYDSGTPLNKLGISRTMYKIGIDKGLLKKIRENGRRSRKKKYL